MSLAQGSDRDEFFDRTGTDDEESDPQEQSNGGKR